MEDEKYSYIVIAETREYREGATVSSKVAVVPFLIPSREEAFNIAAQYDKPYTKISITKLQIEEE